MEPKKCNFACLIFYLSLWTKARALKCKKRDGFCELCKVLAEDCHMFMDYKLPYLPFLCPLYKYTWVEGHQNWVSKLVLGSKHRLLKTLVDCHQGSLFLDCLDSEM
eukprot:c16690_g2_i1 orf=354-671(-)